MSYYPWKVPSESIHFIKREFERFGATLPSNRSIDEIVEYVIEYVAYKNYVPFSSEEAASRYKSPGMTEPEKFQILGPLEYKLRLKLFESITIEQIHLVAWATLLFCWSQEGEQHVLWYKNHPEIPAGCDAGGDLV